MLEKRYREEVGRPTLTSRALGMYISRNIRKKQDAPKQPVISDPPPRWSYYNTFDDRVWVRKGRKEKKPVPYKDRGFISWKRRVRDI